MSKNERRDRKSQEKYYKEFLTFFNCKLKKLSNNFTIQDTYNENKVFLILLIMFLLDLKYL